MDVERWPLAFEVVVKGYVAGGGLEFISHTVFFQSQFPHTSVNSFFALVRVKDKMSDFWES